MTSDFFRPAIGQSFELLDGATLVLAAVETVPTGAARPFALLFEGPAATMLPQQLHRLAHATLGALEIFLVPVAQQGDRIVYEAVFN